jgi:hypothetical protein
LIFTGEHPCYNEQNGTPSLKLDGSKGNIKFTIDDKNIDEVYRFNKPVREKYSHKKMLTVSNKV